MKKIFLVLFLLLSVITYLGCPETSAGPYEEMYNAEVQKNFSLQSSIDSITVKISQIKTEINNLKTNQDNLINQAKIQVADSLNNVHQGELNTISTELDGLLDQLK